MIFNASLGRFNEWCEIRAAYLWMISAVAETGVAAAGVAATGAAATGRERLRWVSCTPNGFCNIFD